MANYFVCMVLQRLLLPIIIAACCLFRPVGLSLPYLLLFLYLPLVPVATANSMKGHTGYYLKMVIAISVLISLIQIAFQIVLVSLGQDIVEHCQLLEKILRHVGLVRMDDNLPVETIIKWVAPEIVMLVTSVCLFIALRKISLGRVRDVEANDSENLIAAPPSVETTTWSEDKLKVFTGFGVFLSLLTILMAGILRPSAPGGIYFIIYLSAGTWWACYKELNRAFAVVSRILMVFIAAHITTYLAYQTPWPQELLADVNNNSIPRYLGFDKLYTSSCDKNGDIRLIYFNYDLDVDSYLLPIAIFLCYYTLGITSSLLLRPKDEKKKGSGFGQLDNGSRLSRQVSLKLRKTVMKKKLAGEKWRISAKKIKVNKFSRARRDSSSVPNERTPLMRTSTKRLKDSKNNDETSTVQGETADGIPLENMGKEVHSTADGGGGDETNFIEHFFIGAEIVGSIIYKNSYIFTNIIMMTWSILYHSWLTFVLLIWADILWMIPNQRKAMLRSSPIIVIYAILLLLAGYLYGMNLTDDELPTHVNTTGINLVQIGFIRYPRLPFIHILAKCVFTVMFWVTLRQMFQERRLKKQKSTLADMVAPLQVTVGAATADLAPKTGKKTSGFLTKFGILLNSILVKGWILVVVITLFASGMVGNRMTGFRIVYMALFLLFILIFQFSWKIWKKFIYGFWLVVIVYGMSILILVYSYQFDNFPTYWHKYLGINTDIQQDIGLEQYETKDGLFLHLVNPTLVVIMTVIQLHYFHKKFLKMFEIPVRNNSDTSHATNSSTNYTNVIKDNTDNENNDDNNAKNDDDDDDATIREEPFTRKFRFRKMTKDELKQVLFEFGRQLLVFSEIIWIFLELHLIKVIMLIVFLLSVYNVCLLHITFVVLSVIAVASRTKLQVLVSRILSMFVSILLLAKMIYQVDYIHHTDYDVLCNNVTNPNKINNADWFGLTKADNGLFHLLEGYIFYLAIVTIHAIVLFRQSHMRLIAGRSTRKPQIMFPKVTRANSEKNTIYMLQYLLNYGFYKFGVEICLMALVVLIGTRMDLLACFYSIWLCSLFTIARDTKARIWKLFLMFIVIATIVQYIIIIGIPPGVCIDYPWTTDLLKKVQKWAMLPDASLQKQVKKLIFDFILLMFVSRQGLVFRIEQRYKAQESEFPGGINKPIVEDIHKHGFSLIKNPTPDFTSHIRNWLDILKRGVLLCFFWFTLAIVFLTGTNRVSLFSIGYLIGSFVFLWQGSDFYLRPIKNIISWWTFLLGYNVFVIALKSFLQIAGCLFFKEVASNACWFVQLLGITCIQKFEIINEVVNTKTCNVPPEEVGLFWDGICFGFLIMQLRIFHSYYFCHIVNDTKASNILASRGAQLIEALRAKQMKQQVDHENEILQKIKLKMDRIKATQQKLLQPIAEPITHAEDRVAPLARSHSMSSCAGYHTPIEDEVVTSIIIDGDGLSDLPSELGPFTSRGGSFLQTQVNKSSFRRIRLHAPSPSSAIMTVSLDGYLDPQRLSFSSPPGSDLLPRIPSLDESYPVFSPPPFEDSRETESTQSNTLVPPPSIIEDNKTNVQQPTTLQTKQHRRQSSLNAVSWPDQPVDPPPSRMRRYSTTLNPTDGNEDSPVYRPRTSHRRQSSIGTPLVQEDSIRRYQRRRSSYTSYVYNDDDPTTTTRTGYQRQTSWGPIGEMYHRQSIMSTSSRSPTSHHEYVSKHEGSRSFLLKRQASSSKDAIRSGDYYMFEELDNKVELDILQQKKDEEEGGRLAKKMTLGQLLALKMQDMKRQNEANEQELAMKRRLSFPDEQRTEQTPIMGRSIMSEPISRPRDRRLSKSERTELTDDIAQPDGQKPSTSHASDESRRDESLREVDDVQLDEDDEKHEKHGHLRGLRFIWTFIESLLISLSVKINQVSRNYRYVMKVLAKEKKTLKSSEGFGMGLKISSALFFGQPPPASEQTTEQAAGTSTISLGSVSLDVVDSPRKSWGSSTNLQTRESTPKDQLYKGQQKQLTPSRRSQISRERDSHERRTSVVPEIRILAPSLERGLDEASPYKISPYDIIMDSQKHSDGDIEDFSTKEHSAIVELLTAIWFAILSHTDFVCYLMVFLNQINSASVLSLPLPLMVFFWGTLTIPRPSKTFWITLIAYTQTVVLLKCISQFEMLWWNQLEITPNQPLAPARIFGIEKKKSYATFDLALLLVVFFHRFMLKSMGLWKSQFKEEILPEGTYKMQNGNNSNATVAAAAGTVEIENEKEKQTATVLKQGDTKLELTKVNSETALVTQSDDIVHVSNVVEEPSSFFPGVVKLAAVKYTSSLKLFFKLLVSGASRATRDVYAYMFICDFINFLVLVFGFTSFGSSQGDGGVTAYLTENKVPIAFLVMLLLQFALIIIDRALYLRKYMLGKIIFQYAIIVVIHIWMFFILPSVTERSFNARNPPVIYYLIKCFYLLLAAFQIRCGYPSRIIGNFLTKGFNIINLTLYKIYLLIPFLFELRTLMDWIWTDTSMTLFDWLKMEDIFSNIFQLKCGRTMESKFPQPRGSRKTTISKYIMGGGMLFGLIACIWFPLAMFALGNSVGEANPPFDVTVSLRIGPYEPIYAMSAQDSNIISFEEKDFNALQRKYAQDRTALTFLATYEAADITAVVLASNSTSIWNISPPDRTRLLDDIVSNHSLTCRFKYTISRKTYNKENPGVITGERSYNLEKNNPYRPLLASMLQNQTDGGFIIPQVFPKFLKVKNAGELKPIPQLIPGMEEEENEDLLFRNLSLNLFHTMGTIDTMWWEVKEVCNDSLYLDILSQIPLADCATTLVTYLFNDKIFPPTLQWLTAGGIIGMYSTFIILFSRIIRGIFSGMSSKIMFEDLPYVDRVLQLCLDIYLVRESFELALEEDLFAKLIFLYRSPETMIKWTRPKDEKLDDDDEDIDDVPNDDDDDDDIDDNNDKNVLRKRKTSPV